MKGDLMARCIAPIYFFVLFVCGTTTLLFFGAEARASDAGGVCGECHKDIAASSTSSYHGKIWRGTGDGNTCQSCHGLGDKHMEDPSPQTIISFDKDSGRDAESLNGRCLACHESSRILSHWDMGEHSGNDVTCVSCHKVHAARSTVDQPTVCYTCHRSIKVQVSKQSHHPIKEGKIKCSDCHNSHGTLASHMIKAESVNELCYQCHPDKRGPYIYEHPPVAENCAICHTSHGSRHSRLLTEKIPSLCQDCHDWSRHPGTPYDAETGFSGSSPSNRFFSRSCLNCHGTIHGSSHFENHLMTR